MILKGSQRAGGAQLAAHLMNVTDNEHVTIHDLRGFVADDLHSAFKEAYAISRGTKCRQFLFSLSLSPPETESVPVDIFEKAIGDIEDKMGLTDQPRAIVFHEKEGRRHAHCVWSRIDIENMKAINLSHYKLKLRDISKQLYLENDWRMPNGLKDCQLRDPLNFTQAEWQQAKRIQSDPRIIKQAFQESWATSDSRASFEAALSEHGLYLARGDRRGYVAIDCRGEVYALARWMGIKTRDVKAKLGDPEKLPSIEDRKAEIGKLLSMKFNHFADELAARHDAIADRMEQKRKALVDQHRSERAQLSEWQRERWIAETRKRSEKLPRGLKALWFRVTGKYRAITKENEAETLASKERDRLEFQNLIDRQLTERQQLGHEIKSIRFRHTRDLTKLYREVADLRQSGFEMDDDSGEAKLRPRPHLRI